MKIGVVGGGAWGTALASVAAREGEPVLLWAREPEVVEAINASHENPLFLPGIALPGSIEATGSLDALGGCDALLVVVPAQHVRAVLGAMSVGRTPLVLCAKGIERETGTLLSAIADEIVPNNPVAALSGPSFAADVAKGLPTAVVVAARDEARAAGLALRFSTESFRCYSTDDLVGVEIGRAHV